MVEHPGTSQAVVAGHLCLDVIPTFETGGRLPAPGQLLQIGRVILSTGGPVSNVGLALHILGVDTQLMGKVGDDEFGRVVLNLIRQRNPALAEGVIIAPGEVTSYTIVLNPPGRDRSFLHCPGANDTFCARDVNLAAVGATRVFHFGYPPVMARMYGRHGAELAEIFRTVKRLGVTTSLDLAMVDPNSAAGRADWGRILRATLPYVDVFMPSIEEVMLLLRRSEYERMSAGGSLLEQITPGLLRACTADLLSWGAGVVCLKLGHRGLYMRTGSEERILQLGRAAPPQAGPWAGRELWAPVFQVNHFVGTTGSGDATFAGYLAALLTGCAPEEALTFACAVGACNVEAADALTGLRGREETWTRVRSGWPRASLTLDEPGWHLDTTHQVWVGPEDRRE